MNNATFLEIPSPDEPIAHAPDPVLRDWVAYYDLVRSDQLKGYEGQFIAILNGRVLGAGDDPIALGRKFAAEQGVPFERLVLPFVDDGRRL